MYYFFQIKGLKTFLAFLFLGSFIGFGHQIIILSTIYQIFEGDQKSLLGAMQGILILLPMILCFYHSGLLSDTCRKKKTIQISAWISLGLSILLTMSYSFGFFWLAFSAGILLACKHALFFPTKFSYFRDFFTAKDFVRSCTILQITIIASMLVALVLFGNLLHFFSLETLNISEAITSSKIAGLLFVFLACCEVLLSYKLPDLSSTSPIAVRSYPNPFKLIHEVFLDSKISSAIIVSAIFWMLIQLCFSILSHYLQSQSIHHLSLFVICLATGGIAGAIFTYSLSRNYLELGVIPFGFLGIIIYFSFLILLPSALDSLLLTFLFGLSGSLIIIPFFASILRESTHLGKTLACYQGVQSIAMIFSLAITLLLAHLSSASFFIFIFGLISAIFGLFYCIKKEPSIFVRFLLTLTFNQRYRLIVEGFSNIPQNKGVLLVGNHMSFIDWAIVQMAIPQRVYFAIEHNIHSKWLLKFFLNRFGIIPHTSTNDLLCKMNTLLSQNQIVCFFPEGAVSTHGHLNEFKKDFSPALNDTSLVIPFYIRGLWGTSFSRSNESFKARNHSLLNKRNITIAFGEALPPYTPKEKIKNAIFDLSFVAWKSQCQIMPTIGRAWISIAKTHLFQTSIIDPISGKFSFGKVLALSLLLSRKIRKTSTALPQGEFVPNKECIGILLPSSFASSLCNLSILLASKVSVNLNFTAGLKSLNLAIQSAGIKRILTSKTFLTKLKERGIVLEFENIELLYMEDLVKDFKSQKIKLISYFAMAFLLPSAILKKIFSPEKNTQEVACILFSSGSEGVPKGVMLNHQNIMSNIAQISDVLCMQDDDAILSSLPPFHAFGLTVTSFLPLLSGIPSITYADPTDACGIAQSIAKHKATIMCGTSTFLGIYTRHPKVDRLMFSSLRIVVSGAEKLKSETRNAFENKFQRVILEGYGATETTPVISVNLPSRFDADNEEIHKANKVGSVGMPLPGTTLKIVDPETMEELPHRREGLILVGGYQVMVGYLNNPTKTQEVIVEFDGMRWYKTGDKGYLDEDGFLYIIDRYSRFAKIGGEMVSLGGIEEEVTQIIEKHKQLGECRCVAIALEDEKKGEMIALLIQSLTDESYLELVELIKHSSMPAICKPRHYFKIESIPLLGSGKVDLKRIKDLAMTLLNSQH